MNRVEKPKEKLTARDDQRRTQKDIKKKAGLSLVA